ncbi:MAG: T9SS type A sorting domain-containing protein [Bacteroidales bacterium]|nr:T9SS type A sorting domain-containing protein [Bacteroidales bacterium]
MKKIIVCFALLTAVLATSAQNDNTCEKPTGLQVTEIYPDGAKLQWHESESSGYYYVYYKKQNASQYDSVLVTDTVFEMEQMLDSSSVYSIYVRTFCDEDDFSDKSNEVTVNTDCSNLSAFPYSEDFEQYGSNVDFPPCWIISKGDEWGPYITGNMVSGSFVLMMPESGDMQVFALPRVDNGIDVTSLKVSFNYKSKWVGMPLAVGVMSDPYDVNTFVLVDTVSAWESLVYKKYTVTFDTYEGSGKYVAFYLGYSYVTGVSYPSCFIDDVELDLAVSDSACSLPPSFVTVSEITQDNAVVSWKENTPAQSWYVYFKPKNATVYDSVLVEDSTKYDFQYQLDENTEYSLYLRAYCSEDLSACSDTVSFKTLCYDIEELPYKENFNSYAVNTYPSCWFIASEYHSYSYGDFPSVVADIHAAKDKCLSLRSDYQTPCIAVFTRLSDDIDITSLTLCFDYLSVSTQQSMTVGIMDLPFDTSSFWAADTVKSINVNTWENKKVKFTDYQGQGRYIALFLDKTNSYTVNAEVRADDIVLDSAEDEEPCAKAPSSLAISNITSSSAWVTWDEDDEINIDSWYLYYKKSSSVVYDSVQCDSNKYFFNQTLLPSESYDVYVVAVCDEETFSDPSTLLTFSTKCQGIDSLPYSENFNTWEYNEFSPCWFRTTDTEIIGPEMPYPTILVNGYNQSNWLAFMTSGQEKNIAVMPALSQTLGDITNIKIKFRYTDFYSGQLIVGIMQDPDNESTFTAVDTVTSTGSWDEKQVEFSSCLSSGRYIAFYAGWPYNNGNDVMLGIDEIVIDYIQTPAQPCQDVQTVINAQITEGETYTLNGFNESEEGVYTLNLQTYDGCDSTVTLHLTVIALPDPCEDVQTELHAQITEGETYALNGFNESKEGVYTLNLQTYDGCDSTVTLYLTVMSNSLTDARASNDEISLYPNPVTDVLQLHADAQTQIKKVTVINCEGKTMDIATDKTDARRVQINASHLAKGQYYIIIETEKQTITKPFIKQ